MSSADEFRAIVLSLPGTIAVPHLDRTAFKVDRNYVTLAADGESINVRLEPDEQAFRTSARPEIYSKISNGWGDMGWTTIRLSAIDANELRNVLTSAWQGYGIRKKKPGKSQVGRI